MHEVELIEKLAELCHEQWSDWMKYLFSRCKVNFDGSVTIPEWAVTRWKNQIITTYEDLSENEKNSDRDEARKFIKLLKEEGVLKI